MSPASVELLCRLEMPALCAVREVQQVSVRQLGGGLHEVSFDVIVAANTRWTLTVKSRASANRHAERVVFRIRAPDHLAALQLVQFEVIPTAPR